MSTFQEVDNETVASVNFCFAEVNDNDILQMQYKITIPNDMKKAMKLGMKVFR